ncbi:MAG: PD-(D/E)XK nuclease family protein [Elusimicrobiota bacterium]
MTGVIALALADDLIARVADHALTSGIALERTCFVFGGRRPGLFLKRELACRLGTAFHAPGILTIEECMTDIARRVHPARSVSVTDAAYTLYTLVQRIAPGMLKDRESFARFYPWAVELNALIGHLDREHISDDRLRAVQNSADIGYEVPASVNALLQSVATLRSAFHDRLEKAGLATAGMDALRAGDATVIDFPSYDRVYFCGLFYLHQTECMVVRSLLDQKKAVAIFQGSAAAWPVLKNLEDALGARIRPAERALPQFSLYAGADTREQAAIARTILEKVSQPGRTVFVVPDGTALVPVLAELSPTLKDFNVSLGYPAQQSSLFALIESLFAAQLSRIDGKYAVKEYVRVILHPLVKNMRFAGNPALTRIVAHKIEEGFSGSLKNCTLCTRSRVTLEDIENDAVVRASAAQFFPGNSETAVTAVLRELHDIFFRAWEQALSYADAAHALERMIDELARRGFLGAHPLNAAAGERMLEASREIATSLARNERPPAADVFEFMKNCLAGEMVSLPGSPLRGLQVLGLLESRNLSFETVVMMDLNESVVPRAPRIEALIPPTILRELGLRSLATEEEIHFYHFQALLAPAKSVHLIYARNDEHERSRFLERMIWENQKAAGALTGVPVHRPRSVIAPADVPPLIEKTADMVQFLREHFLYSATSINAYLGCPQKFFFQYVCHLKAQDTPGAEPDVSDIGIFVHRLMAESCQPLLGKKMVFDAAFRSRFDALLHARFARELAPRMPTGGFLLEEVLSQRLQRFLEREESRVADAAVLSAIEQKCTGAITANKHTYSFTATIDRIEDLIDGTVRIIDFKTGTIPASGVRPEKLRDSDGVMTRESVRDAVSSFQLYIYRELFARNLGGAVVDARLLPIRPVNREDEPGVGLFKKKATDEDRARALDACREGLAFILAEITNPAMPFTADRSDRRACTACPFYYACR